MLIFLETERRLLRQFNLHDSDLLVELDGDPRVMRYITGGDPTSRDEVEGEVLPAFLDYYRKSPGHGFWAAIEKLTGDFLGWFHYRPDPGIHSISRNWATACATRLGERDTRPRAPVP